MLWSDGDRRRLTVVCPSCRHRTMLEWEAVGNREQGEVPVVACLRCGVEHDDVARRRMLLSGRWEAQLKKPVDEDVASYQLSRLDSRRSTLAQVCREWRRARLAAERGDAAAWSAFRNTVPRAMPADTGGADVEQLLERRERTFDLAGLEQVVAGCDVQDDRDRRVRSLGFGGDDIWIFRTFEVLGDPREDLGLAPARRGDGAELRRAAGVHRRRRRRVPDLARAAPVRPAEVVVRGRLSVRRREADSPQARPHGSSAPRGRMRAPLCGSASWRPAGCISR